MLFKERPITYKDKVVSNRNYHLFISEVVLDNNIGDRDRTTNSYIIDDVYLTYYCSKTNVCAEINNRR